MIIPLKVYDFGGLRAMAHILIRSEKPKLFLPVKAIVDTGSPKTVLGLIDLKRMRISSLRFKDVESRIETINIGGGEVKAKVLPEVNLRFGEDFECDMPIQVPIKEISGRAQSTILGVDFLLKNNLKFIFNPIKGKAYFESNEDTNENDL